jgi:hypothetical protein
MRFVCLAESPLYLAGRVGNVSVYSEHGIVGRGIAVEDRCILLQPNPTIFLHVILARQANTVMPLVAYALASGMKSLILAAIRSTR